MEKTSAKDEGAVSSRRRKISKTFFREARKMRLHADFAERGTANSVHGMNAEGGVANCLWAAESTRIGGA
jgi:hypothetical protein